MTDKPSETPRTDEFSREPMSEHIWQAWVDQGTEQTLVMQELLGRWVEFARTLERELNQVREENEKLREEVKQLKEFRDGKAGPLIL